jgi:hypothetical protein
MAGAEAQAGFYYQNLVAADYSLQLIGFGSALQCLTFENPTRAKHIDDIIAEFSDRTVFVQVKWSHDDTSAITLHNLVTADDESSPLLSKLVRGFRQVAGENGQKEIVLASNRKAGTNRQPAAGFDRKKDRKSNRLARESAVAGPWSTACWTSSRTGRSAPWGKPSPWERWEGSFQPESEFRGQYTQLRFQCR